MDPWAQIVFFEGEDEAALRAEFIELCAKHKNHYDNYEVAKYVFRKLRDPHARALQAAEVWGHDLEVSEAIRQLILLGSDDVETSENSLKRRLLAIADDTKADDKDRISAIKTIAEMQGMITKPIEIKTPGTPGKSGLPIFEIIRRSDVVPVEDTADDVS